MVFKLYYNHIGPIIAWIKLIYSYVSVFYKKGRMTERFIANGKHCTCGVEPISHMPMPKVAGDKMSLKKILVFFSI